MKMILLVLSMILSSTAFAGLSSTEQNARVEAIAKGLRRDLWVRGYSDVSSSSGRISKTLFAQYLVDTEPHNQQRLATNEIDSISTCFEQNNCAVYLISVYSEYHSGSASQNHWILLNTDSGKHEEIVQTTYEE